MSEKSEKGYKNDEILGDFQFLLLNIVYLIYSKTGFILVGQKNAMLMI